MTTVAQDATMSSQSCRRIPASRLVAVELRKMFDTRSGFWMMAGIVILAVVATASVILFAPDGELVYDNFAAALGVPMAVILPMVAILAVTSEWTQRSGLGTFTLVPHRGRIIRAKAAAALAVGVVSMLVAFSVGAVGNVLGTAIRGTDLVWDVSPSRLLLIPLANVLGMMMGFTLGVLIRNSPGAIVTYFVYAFVLPPVEALLAARQQWFQDLQPWVDFNYAKGALFDGGLSGEQWAQLGVAGTLWLVIPLAAGLLLMRRSEVK